MTTAILAIALGGGTAQSETAGKPDVRPPDAPIYIDGIDRGAPPPALASRPALPAAPAAAPSVPPSAYAWGPETIAPPGEPIIGDGSTSDADGDDAWALRCEERVCFIQYVPGDFEAVSRRRFAVNLGWSPSLGQFELETRFLAGAIDADIRALSVEVNGQQIALLPFVRCNDRSTCWYRALLAGDQVERLANALVLALVPLESASQAREELRVSVGGLRRAFARLLEAAPEASAAIHRAAAPPPPVYTSPSLDEGRGVYLPYITSPTRSKTPR